MIKFFSHIKTRSRHKQNQWCHQIQRSTLSQKGFSLPELIIVIAIFVIISSVAMFNQGKLSSSVLLTNMAYEVGLAVREAQTYGIGVRSEDAEGSNFAGQYGVFFDISTETSKRQVIVFADGVGGQAPDYTYEQGEEKYIYEFENRRGNHISALCIGEMTNGTCSTEVGNTLSVLFKRPNPAAMVFSSSFNPAEPRSDRVYIVVSSLEGDDCRAVIVESTGQIRVEDHTKGACSNGSVTP